MFDIARAALLRAGVAEDKLPRTHSGVIDAFRQHAVQSGQIDRELAADLSRTESHRIKADYTGIEIEPKIAAETVAKAEVFVQTVERVFALDELSLAAEYKNHNPSHDDKVSEPGGLSRKSRARVLTRNHSRQRRCDVRRAKTGCAYGSTESRARKASTMPRMPAARPDKTRVVHSTVISMSKEMRETSKEAVSRGL